MNIMRLLRTLHWLALVMVLASSGCQVSSVTPFSVRLSRNTENVEDRAAPADNGADPSKQCSQMFDGPSPLGGPINPTACPPVGGILEVPTSETMAPTAEPVEPVEPAIDIKCTADLTVEPLAEEAWSKDIYGNNHQYYDFFTPLAYSKGSLYWLVIGSDLRPVVLKISNGKVERQMLAANYQADANPHNLFSLGVDKAGYIHLSGDMHNGPNPPESTAGRKGEYPNEYKDAPILYWKSKLPNSVAGGFEFLGHTPSRAIPAESVNGIRFLTDNKGELYVSAPVNSVQTNDHFPGVKAIGLYRYDTQAQVWHALGGEPDTNALQSKVGQGVTLRPNRVLFWDIGGQQVGSKFWFQGFFSRFRFDQKNRLHFASSINTKLGKTQDRLIYAVSEDGGTRWKRADGSTINALPVRAADATAGQGDVVSHDPLDWYASVTPDSSGNLGVLARGDSTSGVMRLFLNNGSGWQESYHSDKDPHPHQALVAPGKIITVRQGKAQLTCKKGFEDEGVTFAIPDSDRITNIDETSLRKTGVLYGVAINTKTGKQRLVKIAYPHE